jgi:hypothetical protein
MKLKVLDLFIVNNQISKAKIEKTELRYFKPIPDLACKEVLWVEIICKMKDRNITEGKRIAFRRISLDKDGGYYFDLNHFKKVMYNYHLYIELVYGKKISTLRRIPYGPEVPTSGEYFLLKEYLNKYYPIILEKNGQLIENAIINVKQKHNVLVALVKRNKSNWEKISCGL